MSIRILDLNNPRREVIATNKDAVVSIQQLVHNAKRRYDVIRKDLCATCAKTASMLAVLESHMKSREDPVNHKVGHAINARASILWLRHSGNNFGKLCTSRKR